MSVNWFGVSRSPHRMDEVKDREVILMERCTVSGALLTVVEGHGTRALCLGTMSKTEAAVDSTGQVVLVPLVEEWVQCVVLISLAWLWGEARSVLHCGIGGGIIPRVLHELTSATSHCLEIEPEVLAAAQTHFGLQLDGRCTAGVADAAAHLSHRARGIQCAPEDGQSQRLDVIIVDCFTANGLAPAVAGGELFPHLASCLCEDGVCLLNHFAPSAAAERAETSTLMAQLCECFDAVYSLQVRSSQNVIAVCHHGPPRDAAAWAAQLAPTLERAASLCPDVTTRQDWPSLDQRIVLAGGLKACTVYAGDTAASSKQRCDLSARGV